MRRRRWLRDSSLAVYVSKDKEMSSRYSRYREYQPENIIECICVEAATPRGKDGRRSILPWILMVPDIAFTSIYIRFHVHWVYVLLMSSLNKKGFVVGDNMCYP